MSQVATISNSEVSSAIIGTENANPNAESAVLLKVKDNTEESQICSENLRSESSTPVKEIAEEQPAAENQIAGIYFGTFSSMRCVRALTFIFLIFVLSKRFCNRFSSNLTLGIFQKPFSSTTPKLWICPSLSRLLLLKTLHLKKSWWQHPPKFLPPSPRLTLPLPFPKPKMLEQRGPATVLKKPPFPRPQRLMSEIIPLDAAKMQAQFVGKFIKCLSNK